MIEAVAGVAGRVLSGIFPHAVAWFNKPKLILDFEGGNSNIVHDERKEGEKLLSFIYVRVRVRNKGRHTAKGCRVFLTGLKEVLPGGNILPTALDDSKVLAWAGWHFSPIDVPSGVEFYVDVMRVSKHDRGWLFSVEKLFSSQQNLKNYAGTYRFHLMVSGDNAAPAHCEIDVTYNGDWHGLRAVAVKPS